MKKVFKEKIYSFEVPKKDVAIMMANAIRLEENFTKKKLDISTIHEDSLNHILLNYIRHQTIENYHKNAVNFAHNETLTEKEYFKWFKAVNNAIVDVYPFLKKTIAQQIAHKKRKLFTNLDSKK